MEKVSIYEIDVEEARPYQKELFSQISKFRQERAESYYHEDDELRSIISAFLVKKYVKCEELTYNAYGKPYAKNGVFFNVSHSGKKVVIAIAEKEVGIDVQEMDKDDLSHLQELFKDVDFTSLSLEDKYLHWANKESITKCTGSGIKEIKEVPSHPLNGSRTYEREKYYSHSFINDGYAYSVTIKDSKDFAYSFKTIKVKSLLKK